MIQGISHDIHTHAQSGFSFLITALGRGAQRTGLAARPSDSAPLFSAAAAFRHGFTHRIASLGRRPPAHDFYRRRRRSQHQMVSSSGRPAAADD